MLRRMTSVAAVVAVVLLAGSGKTASLSYGGGGQVGATGFKQVAATRSSGSDTKNLSAIDYAYGGYGGW